MHSVCDLYVNMNVSQVNLVDTSQRKVELDTNCSKPNMLKQQG